MLWLVGRLSGGPDSAARKKVVLAACSCASLALTCVPEDGRPRVAIEVASAWAQGESGITMDDVHPAASDAADAVFDAATANAANRASPSRAAAYSAASSISAATDASCYPSSAVAANSAASAAHHAAAAADFGAPNVARDAADDAGEPSARRAMLKRCADIVRERYPTPPRYRKDA